MSTRKPNPWLALSALAAALLAMPAAIFINALAAMALLAASVLLIHAAG